MSTVSAPPLRVCLFGAAPDTGNLGVSALCFSVMAGLAKRGIEQMTVFDHGLGSGVMQKTIDSHTISYNRCGAINSRRFYQPENLWNMRLRSWLGGLGNNGVRTIVASDIVLDISGGDSFTDLYGARRFSTVAIPKLIALRHRTPLILLPQSYGPFASAKSRRVAEHIVQRAAMAWARDERSYEVLRELAGDRFDPAKHKLGVDVAFGLPASEPALNSSGGFTDWLNLNGTDPIVGFNVSGLIFNQSESNAVRDGFRADYHEVVKRFLQQLLRETSARIVLAPHVLTPQGHFESDIDACQQMARALGGSEDHRIHVLSQPYDPMEIKSIISRTNWFCGTRMHSTIAALSSGVPTAAMAYSDKTLGVFETCGQGDHVADLRRMTTSEVLDRLWWSWGQRTIEREQLESELSNVRRDSEAQLDEIVSFCHGQCQGSNFAREAA